MNTGIIQLSQSFDLRFDWLALAGKKKALVFSPTLATTDVEKKVPERHRYGMSDPSGFQSEKEKHQDFQPTKKRCTKLSTFKGKQTLLSFRSRRHFTEVLLLEDYFEEVCSENTENMKWAVLTMDCVARTA